MKEILVIGCGIAGATVALQLKKRSIEFDVIDEGKSKSSNIAAGIINPIVFRRLLKTWQIDTLLPYAVSFYREIETELGCTFLNKCDIYKIISSRDEEEFWKAKLSTNEIDEYLELIEQDNTLNSVLNNNFKYGKVKESYYLNISLFLKKTKEYFNSLDSLIIDKFDYNSLIINKDNIEYKGNSYKNVIFCQGFYTVNNPFFKYIPMALANGEIIDLEIEGLNANVILNKDFFLLPIGNNIYRLGATYKWFDINEEPTEAAQIELIGKMKKYMPLDYKIIKHEAAIRPASIDRRPIIGSHHKFKQLSIFNGLGAKGVVLAPYLSNHLLDNLFEEAPLIQEVNISRFDKYILEPSVKEYYRFKGDVI